MNNDRQYIDANRKHWDQRVKIHVGSDFYDNRSFIEGRNTINSIEQPYLQELAGKRVLHLQCHFGQDSISLKRMGAASVTGVDFSAEAIETARRLAGSIGEEVQFIQCNVLELDKIHDQEYDLIFCSYGVTGWLPSLDKWARNINRFLVSGGRFLYAEFHPVMWMYDSKIHDVANSYLHDGVIIEQEEGTYTDGGENLKYTSYGWNYGISEVITPLLNTGMKLKTFKEFDYSPYECWPNMVKTKDGFQIRTMEGKLPMVYLIEMIKL